MTRFDNVIEKVYNSTMEPTKTPLVTFEAPADLLARFDKVVASRYTNRSALLRELMAREVDALLRSEQETTQEAANGLGTA